jgi:hypothetical protein
MSIIEDKIAEIEKSIEELNTILPPNFGEYQKVLEF